MVRPSTEDLHVCWLGPMGIGQCCIAGGSNHGCESSQEKSMKKRENNIYKTSTSSIKTFSSSSFSFSSYHVLSFFFLFPMTPSITVLQDSGEACQVEVLLQSRLS